MSQTWILVADGARARLFARAADGALTEIACHTNPDGSAPQRHLGALPRTQESHGSARHAIEPHTDEHDKSQQRFARSLRDLLEQARTAQRMDRLVLVAPPRFLGMLHASFEAPLQRLVQRQIGHDLSALPPAQLRERLDLALAG